MKRILCYGDSNTYGYDPRSYLGGRYPEHIRWTGLLEQAGWNVVDEGENGREIPTREWQFSSLTMVCPITHTERGHPFHIWLDSRTKTDGVVYVRSGQDGALLTLWVAQFIIYLFGAGFLLDAGPAYCISKNK